jgi:hypothetical protein
MKWKPELHPMGVVQWQLFATFTFRVETSERNQLCAFFAAVRKTASNYGVHFKQVIWCLRQESGEITGREHLHALIAGLPAYAITERACRATESIWRSVGGGHPVVRVYDDRLDAASYILKGLEQARAAEREGANLYEFQKFGGSCNVTLSESFVRVVHGRRQIAKRRQSGSTQSGVSASLMNAPVDTSSPVAMPDQPAGNGVAELQTGNGWTRESALFFVRR